MGSLGTPAFSVKGAPKQRFRAEVTEEESLLALWELVLSGAQQKPGALGLLEGFLRGLFLKGVLLRAPLNPKPFKGLGFLEGSVSVQGVRVWGLTVLGLIERVP